MYDNETWEQFQKDQQAKRDAEHEANYDAFMDAINSGDDEAIEELTADWVEQPPVTAEMIVDAIGDEIVDSEDDLYQAFINQTERVARGLALSNAWDVIKEKQDDEIIKTINNDGVYVTISGKSSNGQPIRAYAETSGDEYVIHSHVGQMPAHHRETFETSGELIEAMLRISHYSKWSVFDGE